MFSDLSSRYPRLTHAAGLALGFVILALALYFLAGEIGTFDPGAVRAALETMRGPAVGSALVATAVGFAAIALYERGALHLMGRRDIPDRLALETGYVANAIGYVLGFPAITAGAIRWRAYSAAGMGPGAIATLTAISSATLWGGIAIVFAAALAFDPGSTAGLVGLPAETDRVIGIALLVAIGAVALALLFGPRTFTLRTRTITLPGRGLVVAQVGLGLLDIAAAIATLWFLLPVDAVVAPGQLAGVFVVAIVLGFVSHVPGGLGVFEALMIAGLPQISSDSLLASLIVFRVVYYLVPFVPAVLLLGWRTLLAEDTGAGRIARLSARLLGPLAPSIATAAVFAGGVVLLVSGALPAAGGRMHWLHHVVPLPFVETSHLIGSVVGVVLLILARGLLLRLRSAWRVTVMLLAAAIVVSLIKGFDYEEAVLCALVLGLLVVERGAFYRLGSVLDQPFSPAWIFVIALVVATTMFIGFLAFSDVDYSNQLWWDFHYKGDAPRFLRASLGVVVTMLGFGLYGLIRSGRQRDVPVTEIPEAVLKLVAGAPQAESCLALLGDKNFLVADDGSAFLMYRAEGHSFIAMGDPVGAAEGQRAVAWRLREMADARNARVVFYQITPELLPLFVEMGLGIFKIGEMARVRLANFTTEGKAGADFRYVLNRARKDGLEFAILPMADVPAHMGELAAVSDAWLGEHRTAEKGFSLGRFDPAYLARWDIAVVRRAGQIIAFANIWRSGDKHEYSIDLMRHRPDAPNGVMDYLFTNLIQSAKAEGYQWFDLGMAPLTGLSDHPLAPAWNRVARLVYAHGNQLYNFAGLRRYKEKFHPEWEPRYIAGPKGLAAASAMLDVATLIAGGRRRLFTA